MFLYTFLFCEAQLLISKTASFEFHNLKDAFISLKPNKSTMFFFEVLKNILNLDKSIKNVSHYLLCNFMHNFYEMYS